MADQPDSGKKRMTRRDFLRVCTGSAGLMAGSVAAVGAIGGRFSREEQVWQLDPDKCVQCGRCATACVLSPSAVKCVHAFDVCGYCNLCGGYHQPKVKETDTAAENQLCPTAAIRRTYIEGPYYEYTIAEDLCIGCAKCVKGCTAFGNGSLYLQVRHDRCLNCNECAIAKTCPSGAFRRVPVSGPYILKGAQGRADE
jgi:electron transport complex protein RnfB